MVDIGANYSLNYHDPVGVAIISAINNTVASSALAQAIRTILPGV